MAQPQPRERLVRMSLREMLLLIALCALALVSLQYASPTWESIVASIVALAFVAAAIVALVDRQARQAFAIGFAVSVAVYGLALFQSSLGSQQANPEFNPDTGKLLTTQLLRPVFTSVADSRWIDFRTGKEVPNFDPNKPGPDQQFVSLDERPERGAFMRIGHCWWALVLGYLGGWFGRFVYLRQAPGGTLAACRH